MSIRKGPGSIAAIVVSLFLLGEGAWGLVSPPAYGIFPINTLRAVIHLAFGLGGLWMIQSGKVRPYLQVVGSIVLLVGISWFLPVMHDLVAGLLAVDRNGAIADIILGVIAWLGARAETHTGPRAPRERGTDLLS